MVKDIAKENKLWEKWLNNKNNEHTNELVEYYMYLVDYHVQRITSNLPKSVSKDDIRSLGLFGLYDAIRKFNPSRELKFDTYASFRIKGSIIDGLRKEDWLPRTTRDKVKQIDKTAKWLEQKFQREVSAEEIAAHLGMTPSEVEEAVKDNFFANLLSIEEKIKHSDNTNEEIGDLIPDDTQLLPEETLVQQENYSELADCIKQLKENEQLVLSLFYEKELTFTEIGVILERTTSRISQIHKQAIFKVRQFYQNDRRSRNG